MQISIETLVVAPLERVWQAWTTPAHIVQWNAASDDWHTTRSSVDLRVGGQFSSRMEARDGSFGFDFAGTYTVVEPLRLIECTLGDRRLRVEFVPGAQGVTVRETFDTEPTHSIEQQRQGWQAILDRFRRHVEGGAGAAQTSGSPT
ncbi:MAG: SRPBCC family protein [Rubrivivax sp.]